MKLTRVRVGDNSSRMNGTLCIKEYSSTLGGVDVRTIREVVDQDDGTQAIKWRSTAVVSGDLADTPEEAQHELQAKALAVGAPVSLPPRPGSNDAELGV